MAVPPRSVVDALCIALELLLLGGFVGALLARVRSARRLGTILTERRPGLRWRGISVAGIALVLAAALAFGPRDLHAHAGPILGLAALIQILRPSFADRVCGDEGVQSGWYARRLEHLEEWRLTGDHLRFRLFGEWTAVPCPRELHPAMRVRLERLAGDRESPFRD